MRAFIIGRFQPFHKGHLSVIKKIVKECRFLIVGIGSAQYSHTLENPFTAGERYLMISRTLAKEKILNCYIIPIEDVNRYDLWVSHIEALAPKFEVVYTNNPLTKQLFLERNYEVRNVPLYNRRIYSGRKIRTKMLRDKRWEDLLPSEVVEVIKEIKGVERIKTLAKTDVYQLEHEIAELLLEKELTLGIVESCTGGLLTHLLTNIPNASKFLLDARIPYTEKAKKAFGLSEKLLETFGAVSAQTALELARIMRTKCKASIGVGITGFAGPIGGEKVGETYIAIITSKKEQCRKFKFIGSREEIKERAVEEALKLLKETILKL